MCMYLFYSRYCVWIQGWNNIFGGFVCLFNLIRTWLTAYMSKPQEQVPNTIQYNAIISSFYEINQHQRFGVVIRPHNSVLQ